MCKGRRLYNGLCGSLLVILIFSLFGCGSSDSSLSEKLKNTLTEHDFAANGAMTVRYGNTAVMFMEPSDAKLTSHPDTGSFGIDVLPVTIEQPGTYTFSLDDSGVHMTVARAEMLRMPDRTRVLELNAADRTVTVYMDARRYELLLHSGYNEKSSGGADHRAVFLRPEQAKKQQCKIEK